MQEIDLPPLVEQRAERLDHDADEERDRGDLRRHREEGGDRRRRAFVDVGRPHVERHGGDLEGEADDGEDDADEEADRHGLRRRGERLRDGRELGRAGKAVDRASAVEHHPGGERAEDEVFEARLGRAGAVALEGGDDVEREALQLEARHRAR